MVVRFNVSHRQDLAVPADLSSPGARVVPAGPLYNANDVLTVLRFGQSVVLWTAKANQDVHWELGWDLADVAKVVREAVTGGRLISSEWCEQKPSGPYAPCDAYEVTRVDEPKLIYVKFAIAKTGMALLVVSCHTSNPGKL